MKVRDVMTGAVVTATPSTTFKEAAELMLDYGVSGLPVVDATGRLAGLVTEADLMSKEAFGGPDHDRRPLSVVLGLLRGERRWTAKAAGLTAGDVMSRDLVTVRPDEDIRQAARLMLERGVKRLPVMEDGRLVGIVSRPDLLRLFHRPDTEIAAEIEAKLASPRHCPEEHDVTFTVEEGVVVLSGEVRNPYDMAVVEGMARRVPGVVHVVSTLDHPVAGRS